MTDIALVTGGTRGIGAAIARSLRAEGHGVAAVKDDVRAGIVASIPIGRLGDPDEVAQAVSYLASPKAAFCTGSVLTINGGQYIANG